MRQVRRGRARARAGSCASLAEQVLEHRAPGAVGMGSLRDLRELQRVAEQDDVARGGAERERVGERDLAGLVDEEVVDAPGRSSAARTARRCRRCSGASPAGTPFGLSVTSLMCFESNAVSSPDALLQPAEVDPLLSRPSRPRRAGCGSPVRGAVTPTPALRRSAARSGGRRGRSCPIRAGPG